MTAGKQPQSLGFENVFEQVKPDGWTPPKKRIRNERPVDTADIKQVAEATGFISRKAHRTKEPTDQINFRAKVSTIMTFRALCEAQEPSWPYGYGLERAIAALQRELQQEPVRQS